MQRYTISLEDSLAEKFDEWIRKHRYENRSEAVRDLLRNRLGEEALGETIASGECVACVSYTYDHHQRELGRRLTEDQHAHYDLAVSTLHVHLDADQCLEVTLLRGEVGRVREQAEGMIAERGVQHGKVNLVPVSASKGHHHHGHSHHHHDGDHVNVRLPARKAPR
ncbi:MULTISPECIES: nickel-responsive transcriptional regulator NikR [Hydrocarboniphaga]|jgi:CopG family nickel-responsive transcriptional regulator|uniref:Putative nickel-responsive regulator n=1 Tax=Hydrocarboniphaga effusa AP103 TaxID=1172194 RepID=I7ZA58_9GAMM|nr:MULTISPECIES: nickel-responsive transcriptional regulator NikR [Hydrocarboniphaga]EIT68739.1 nickel responsive regulator [Hydrocarboniphaga effusa AP103]MDZ4076917.1 nickel-responsive transcriptional regulator NikR [Hydrocarboniphaga sp.]